MEQHKKIETISNSISEDVKQGKKPMRTQKNGDMKFSVLELVMMELI